LYRQRDRLSIVLSVGSDYFRALVCCTQPPVSAVSIAGMAAAALQEV